MLVAVPERRRLRRVVDPRIEIEAPRRRQNVLDPLMGDRVEPRHAARLLLTDPDVPVAIGLRRIEIHVRAGRGVLLQHAGLRVVLGELPPTDPDVAIPVEAPTATPP